MVQHKIYDKTTDLINPECPDQDLIEYIDQTQIQLSVESEIKENENITKNGQ